MVCKLDYGTQIGICALSLRANMDYNIYLVRQLLMHCNSVQSYHYQLVLIQTQTDDLKNCPMKPAAGPCTDFGVCLLSNTTQ